MLQRHLQRAAAPGLPIRTGVELEFILLEDGADAIADGRDRQSKPCYDQQALMRHYLLPGLPGPGPPPRPGGGALRPEQALGGRPAFGSPPHGVRSAEQGGGGRTDGIGPYDNASSPSGRKCLHRGDDPAPNRSRTERHPTLKPPC